VCASRAHLKHSSAIARYSLAVFMTKTSLPVNLLQILPVLSVFHATYEKLSTALCLPLTGFRLHAFPLLRLSAVFVRYSEFDWSTSELPRKQKSPCPKVFTRYRIVSASGTTKQMFVSKSQVLIERK
jgi:hypothetical protein